MDGVLPGRTPGYVLILTKAAPRFEYRALHRIADSLAPQMRRAFLRAVEQLRAKIDPARLEELLNRGDQGDLGAFWRAFEQEVGPVLRPPITEGVREVGRRTGESMGMAFDVTNPRAVEAIDRQAATLVREITDESRAAIRRVLREGFIEGIPVPEMARRIRGSIGLTERQAAAVENFRAAQLEQGLTPTAVNRRVDRMATRMLSQRATNIARTETIRAASAGQQAAWQEARANGMIPPGQGRVWIVTPDDRLCDDVCAPMEDQVRGIDEPFTTGEGFQVMFPPAHPQCRCAVGLSFPDA